MPRIVAYTYNAGMHCIDCFNRAKDSGKLAPCYVDGWPENIDSEGNFANVVFSTDETECTHCDTCHSPLT